MLSRTKRYAGVAVAALGISAAFPAAAGAAAGPCTAVSQSTGSEVAIVLEGHYTYTKRSGDVILTCHLVQHGVVLSSVTDPLAGPVAALVSDQRIGTDPFSVCYSLTIREPGPPGFPPTHYHYTSC